MATYAAKKSALTDLAQSDLAHSDLAQSDLRSELLYPDLHGALPGQWQSVEKKLIGFSLGLGLFLLVALVIVNHVFPAV